MKKSKEMSKREMISIEEPIKGKELIKIGNIISKETTDKINIITSNNISKKSILENYQKILMRD